MRTLRPLASATLIALLAGCGVSYNVTVRNDCPQPLRVELIDTFATGDIPWLGCIVAPGESLRYEMRDGWRSEGKHAALSLADHHDTSVVTVPIVAGERLFPWTTSITAALSPETGALEAQIR